MMNSLWIAKTGMTAQQTQLDVISHNLANVSTTGFKRNNAVFEDLIYQNLRQVGSQTTEENQLPTGLHLGLGVNVVATSRNFTQGSLQQSGNSLDVAIDGNGFEVQLPDGTTGYTRDGAFKLDSQGRVVTSSGLPVAPGITVPHGRQEHQHQRARHGKRDRGGQPQPPADRPAGHVQLHQLPQAWSLWARTCTASPPPPARRSRPSRAPTAWASSSRASWRTPTSTWWRNWSP